MECKIHTSKLIGLHLTENSRTPKVCGPQQCVCTRPGTSYQSLYRGSINGLDLPLGHLVKRLGLQAPVVATGFQVIVLKWLTVVRLLLGEIPDHSEFKQPSLEKPLRPYFSLAQAVRVGDLAAFS